MAAAAGQVHVEEDDVREAAGDPGDRGPDVVGLAHHLNLVAQLGADPGPEQGVVIDDEYRVVCGAPLPARRPARLAVWSCPARLPLGGAARHVQGHLGALAGDAADGR